MPPFGRHHHHFGFGAYGRGRFRAAAGRGGGVLARDELCLLLLLLIDPAPRHGYDLIREIEGLSSGGYVPSPGVIYPALAQLESRGWARVEERAGRRMFGITAAGEAELTDRREEAAAVRSRIADLREPTAADPAPVVRAMTNLKAALGAALRPDGASPFEIAALIDVVAQKIERLR